MHRIRGSDTGMYAGAFRQITTAQIYGCEIHGPEHSCGSYTGPYLRLIGNAQMCNPVAVRRRFLCPLPAHVPQPGSCSRVPAVFPAVALRLQHKLNNCYYYARQLNFFFASNTITLNKN